MSTIDQIKYTLNAIESVKNRAKEAQKKGDCIESNKLLNDLFCLQVCLEIECKSLIKTDN